MARGWESKAVEDQQVELTTREFIAVKNKAPRTADQVQKMVEKRNLESARAKVRHEIEIAQNERYKEMLARSLRELESKLADLEH